MTICCLSIYQTFKNCYFNALFSSQSEEIFLDMFEDEYREMKVGYSRDITITVNEYLNEDLKSRSQEVTGDHHCSFFLS